MCSSRKSWKSGSFLMVLMACGSRLVFPLLLLVALLMATANPAQAARILCSRPPSTVPTEAVQKKNPPSQTTATIGVPFTYTVTAPLLGNVDSSGSFNITQSADNVAVTNMVVTDDLTMTGASLTYVTNTAYLVNTSTGARTPINGGAPLTLGASSTWLSSHSGILSDSTKHLVFSYENNPALANVPAGENIEIDLTVVLDNSPANTAQIQFSNTANMWFDKTTNGKVTNNIQAEPGTTSPITIVEPNLVVTKKSSVSNLSAGSKAPYTINVQNIGASDAWNATITDNIPAGMCSSDVRPTITAAIYAADGVTPVSGPLVSGTDFTVTWNGGTSSACQLSLAMLTTKAKIGSTQHLIITYQATLDSGITSGTFTNVAGATLWFGADSSETLRREYDKTLTNGTPGVLDFQDACTVTATSSNYYLLKTVEDLTTGIYPATSAFPGDTLRYTLQIQNFTAATMNNIKITDDLGALNGANFFVSGSLLLASTNLPAGTYSICPTCGTNGSGTVTIIGLTVGPNAQYQIQFDVTLAGSLVNGTIVSNQASLTGTDSASKKCSGVSSNPNGNGPAPLGQTSDITSVTINAPGALSKTSPVPSIVAVGQQYSYTITVPAAPASAALNDVRILDSLPPNVSFVSASVISGGTWNVVNTGTATNLILQDSGTGIDIPVGGQAVIKVTVALTNTAINVNGVSFTNSASYTYNKKKACGGTTTATGGSGVSTPMTVVEPHLTITKTVSYFSPSGKPSTSTAVAGDILLYTVTMTNNGNSTAYNADVIDTLPPSVTLVSGSAIAQINGTPVTGFIATPASLAGGVLDWGAQNGDSSLVIPVNGKLVVTFQAKVLSVNTASIVNTSYTVWTSLSGSGSGMRTGAGCPNITQPNNYCSGPATATISSSGSALPALLKQALVSTAALGQPFVYRITIPATPVSTAMYNVSVTDDISLATTGVSLNYVGASARLASGAKSWATLANTGTATNLVLADTVSGGLYVPAGDQLIIDVTVVLTNDTVNNAIGKQFSNTASYIYNRVNGDNTTGASGAPGTSAPVTIAGPNLTLTKTGPVTMSAGTPGTFTLNIQNAGGGAAWNTTITDVIPNVTTPAKGGMCAQAPANITARIYQPDGVTPVTSSLVNDTDYTASFTGLAGTPACTLTIAMKSTTATAIAPTDRLIVTYQASLDSGTAGGLALTNIAGATGYQSADPSATGASGNVHTTTNTLTNGTPGILDFQDAFTVTTASGTLTLSFAKTVFDVTTGQSGATARPGDALQYTLTLQNTGGLAASGITLTDELDKLNQTAMFIPGSLTLTTVPAGANVSLTSATGGAKGTGLVSISNLNIDAVGGANSTLVVVFTARLVPVINSGTKVLNQGQVTSSTLPALLSNDPSQGSGANPTLTTIVSAPILRVQKTVQDMTSVTTTVTAGDTLKYTIKVNNIGTENAVGVTLRDLVPENTSYVANSTTLNGVAVADVSSGVSALQNGMPIDALANPTPGAMPADATASAANTATITFEVKVSTSVVNGTIISNQGFVDGSGAGSGPVPEQPSGNPNSPVPNSPTSVVVGNLPLLYADKTVKLSVDNNGNGLVDPGDVIRYTITLTNSAAAPASGVVLSDIVPANTAYVSGSTTLNGNTVADTAAGVSPLSSGMSVVSTSPTQTSAPVSGTVGANSTGTITFDVRVNAGVASGTIICNQGTVTAAGLVPLLTDSDGNPTNGYQPTCITVGSAQELTLNKSYAVVGGGIPLPGSIVEYTVTATNIGTVPATSVVITDDLTPVLTQSAYVAGSAAMNGSSNGVSFTSPVITANYGQTYGALAPGAAVVLRFRIKLNSSAPSGTVVTNTAQAAWNTPQQTTTSSVTLNFGSQPGSFSGRVWQDTNFNKTFDSGETPFSGWAADVYMNGQVIGTAYTGSDGTYQISGLASNAGTASTYEIHFRAPGAGASTAMLGWADSPFTNSMQKISNIVLTTGGSLMNLNLPLTPNGIVYDSVARTPIAGATLTMLQASSKSPVSSSCFNDPAAQGQVTLSGGYYKFDLNFSDPTTCPSGGDYLIQVTPPSSGYIAGLSKLIPPTSDAVTATFSVPTCPGSAADAVPSITGYCEAQASVLPPATSVAAGPATAYYLHLTFDNARPGDSQIYNNHIAVDPVQSNAISITKTTTMVNVSLGQMVPYTISLTNTLGANLTNLEVVDTPPPGFKYVSGSGVVDGQKVEPTASGTQLIWSIQALAANSQHTINLILVVGAGVSNGDYVNHAQVLNSVTGTVQASYNSKGVPQAVNKAAVPVIMAPGSAASGVAVATVHVAPDPTMDCTDIIGKVFDDTNANGYPDQGEPGLAGVKVVTANGLIATTDKFGRFHITCAVVPDPDRGSNFIMKLDDRTLPTGYRITSDNPLVLRVTRGKMVKFNFGATLHRVVRLDIADGIFEPHMSVIREQWKPKMNTLIAELKKSPSILRISYLADVEGRSEVSERTETVKKMVSSLWGSGPYRLTVETEVYWRRGGPPDKNSFGGSLDIVTAGTFTAILPPEPASNENGISDAPSLGQAVERHADVDLPRTVWEGSWDNFIPAEMSSGNSVSGALSFVQAGGEQVSSNLPGTVLNEGGTTTVAAGSNVKSGPTNTQAKTIKTVKLQNLVPPLRFGSGEADIPEASVARLKEILSGMQAKQNVRLHLVGHTDNTPLFGEDKEKYGDNTALSLERARNAALYLQKALGISPDAVTSEGVGESAPATSNATFQGKAQNRRVEVEVWYDDISGNPADSGALSPERVDRVKVCRVETLCKLRYKEGQSRRARIRNIVPPIYLKDDNAAIPGGYISKVRQALDDLKTKEHVVVKFIGYTDNQPLSERDERIYGNAISLSKARARRAAMAIKNALSLPLSAIDVDGKGADSPIVANDTEKGKAQNRRIEVEFWYDDELQVLPDELQICPEPSEAVAVTQVYDGPSGGIKPVLFDHGEPMITPEHLEQMQKSLDEVKDKQRARLRFIGYTNDERLDRRTAMVYGDDIGLSTSRARRVMDMVKDRLGLTPLQSEFEGHGYVQSDDVARTGFVESDTARVEVEVVYDEMMSGDNTDGLNITKVTRDVTPKDPLALNLMRITVDGKPLDDPNKGIADIERCTDVALAKANVQFKYDDLSMKPRLNVTAWPNVIRYKTDPDVLYPENLIMFRMYTNYQAFITKSEVRIFDKDESVAGTPLAVIPMSKDGRAHWQPTFPDYHAPEREIQYVLRVYDAKGHFDETKPLPLWIVDRQSLDLSRHDAEKELLVGYGENHLSIDNIPKKGGTITVTGNSVPDEHQVFVAGSSVPVGDGGKFVTEEILPSGMHTVEVAILDNAGNGDLFLRDLELKKSDWFATGIADFTVSNDSTSGPGSFLYGSSTQGNSGLNYTGRLAYYTKGTFGDGWQLTSSADTEEGPIRGLFSNFGETTPDALFRSIDPKYYYPTYGDDGSVEEGAPTLGKFYLKVEKDGSYGMWGDFKVAYDENDLARIERGLYGANLHYQTTDTTSFGEKRFAVDGFSAQPGTVAMREQLLGTGGTLYYLQHQGILTGSESVTIEVHDKDSGIVVGEKTLTVSIDYTIDYLQGRVYLTQPLSPTASSTMLVSAANAAGDLKYLVVRYEYVPSAGDTNSMSLGGQAHVWLNDYVKLGVTANKDGGTDNPNELTAADVTVRKSAMTWVKVETSQTSGPGITSLTSNDGGMTQTPTCPSYSFSTNGVPTGNTPCSYFGNNAPVSADAYRIDGSLGFGDIFAGASGQMTIYTQSLGAGYSAPGLETATDTKQYGGTLKAPLSNKVDISAKADVTTRDQGLDTSTAEVDLNYHATEHWTFSPGVRMDKRQDNSPVVPPTETQGDLTDAALRATYDSKGRWSAYGYAQGTVENTGDRESNDRIGTGGEYRITDHVKVNGEVSSGDMGGAGKLGMEYLYSDRTNMYLNYVYDNETPDNGIRAGNGSIVSGMKTRYSDSVSVYAEEKYAYGNVPTGLTHAAGVDLAPADHWNLGIGLDYGNLKDPVTYANLERNAATLRVGYGNNGLIWASAFEYRIDKTEVITINPDTTTSESTVNQESWLVKNDLKYQINESSRIIGKFNHAESHSDAAFFGGNYTEAVLGYGYRPVTNDKLNTLFKYTYFYNVPTAAQVTDTVTYTSANSVTNTAADSIQKSNILSLDATYDLTHTWSISAKYAYRLGWVSETLQNPVFYESRASLYIASADWHFVHSWDAMVEARLLDLPDAQDKKSGILAAIYRQMGPNIKAGVGYNFSDFSDDLTVLDYKHQGFFFNMIGEF